MNVEEIRSFALSFNGVSESFPFGEETLVFKINNKIFLLVSLEAHPVQFNVKCDPGEAMLLREKYAAILPGYHMNKKHWNTVLVDGSVKQDELKTFIENSYRLVAPKR